jgi:hypothetical protein
MGEFLNSCHPLTVLNTVRVLHSALQASFSSASNIHLFLLHTTKKNTPKWQPLLWKQKQIEQSPSSPFLIQCLFLTIWPLYTDDTMLYLTALLRTEDLYNDKLTWICLTRGYCIPRSCTHTRTHSDKWRHAFYVTRPLLFARITCCREL